MPTMRTGRKGAPKSVQIGLCALTTVVLTFGLATVLRGYRTGAQAKGVVSNEAKEAAYKANNIGVALLEQFKYDEGAEQFRRALKLDPG
ncbi:MAG TPA: tetratricopeptide repeat protein, partial [Blastocatellia bacterium]|nr:tetratricopeptide repeat protein [Blastocatellia bacterium]